ncbi:MAG: NAD(P)-dependent oxidoreductase [Planctomycetota bacterium]|jgi:phosphoglycerate dehydrogenase-like enzyme
MALEVFLPNPWDPESMDHLRRLLEPEVSLQVGPEVPEPAEYRILVSGRPTEELLQASPQLATLIIPFAGVPAGTKRLLEAFEEIAVHNLHHNAAATAEMAMALLLAGAKRIVPFDRNLRRKDWSARYEENPSVLLEGKTALVLGYGAVGKRVARACRGFGMEVIAVRRRPEETGEPGVEIGSIESMPNALLRAQVVNVCLPATESTEGFLGEEELSLLPKGALLVNIGRGRTVQEKPLYEALKEGRLFAAGLDVWYEYPKSREAIANTAPANFPFHELDQVVMSPHRAGHVEEDMKLRAEHLAVLLNAAARNEPLPNPVDLNRGY